MTVTVRVAVVENTVVRVTVAAGRETVVATVRMLMTVTVTGVGLIATETVVVMVSRAVAVMVRGGGQVWGGRVAPGCDGWDGDGPEQTPKEGLQPAPQWESVLPHLGGVRCAFADFDKEEERESSNLPAMLRATVSIA